MLVGLDLPSGVGKLKQGSDPTSRQLSESEKKHLRLRVKQLISDSLNGMRIRRSLPQPYTPQAGTLVSWKAQIPDLSHCHLTAMQQSCSGR